jgi:outer membrane protein assembly factor BamB
VSQGRVYVLDREHSKVDILRCLDLTNGRELWNFTYPAPGKFPYNGSRAVPTIDGDRIYICGPLGHLHCLQKKTRKVLWKKNIWTDFGGKDLPKWAISQNPLIYKDLLLAASQTQKAGVVAYDKFKGNLRWASPPLGGRAGYVSPKIIKIGGQDQVVMISAVISDRRSGKISALGEVRAMDPKNGKTLWTYTGWQCRIPIANVTEIGDGRIFISGGYRAGSAMIRVKKEGGQYQVKELFKEKKFGVHIHPAVLYRGHLYGHCSTNDTKNGMVCMDLNGNIKWMTKRSPRFDKGGFILVDEMILSVDGYKGDLYLIKPGPSGFTPLAKARLLETKQCWAPLALVDGKLLIRDQKQMKCVLVQ